MGDYMGEYYRGIKGDTRSLDYSSHGEYRRKMSVAISHAWCEDGPVD